MSNFKITVDCIVVGYSNIQRSFNILLSKRTNQPHKGAWALPGGFVKKTEEFEDTANTIVEKETGVNNLFMDQLKAYSLTDINESNRIISIAFYSIVNLETLDIENGNQISKWFNLYDLPKLPFDHDKKVKDTIDHIKSHINTKPYLYKLLPIKFTLNQVQWVYESLFNLKVDNRNFRKQLNKMIYLEKTDELESNVSRRPGYLFKFNEEVFNELLDVF